MDQPGKDTVKTLEQQREYYIHRMFLVMLEFFFIFGIPAGAAFFIGRSLDIHYGTHYQWKLILLGVSFVLSWIIIVLRIRTISRKLQQVEAELKRARAERTSQ